MTLLEETLAGVEKELSSAVTGRESDSLRTLVSLLQELKDLRRKHTYERNELKKRVLRLQEALEPFARYVEAAEEISRPGVPSILERSVAAGAALLSLNQSDGAVIWPSDLIQARDALRGRPPIGRKGKLK